MEITQTPIAKAEMLIRRPVAEVFEAFIDPAITSKFWFTKGSGRIEKGKRILWEWEMYDASTQVDVKELEKNKRILIEWDGYSGTSDLKNINTKVDNKFKLNNLAESTL